MLLSRQTVCFATESRFLIILAYSILCELWYVQYYITYYYIMSYFPILIRICYFYRITYIIWRREHMVGVNMVLAEYHQIQTWVL